MNPALEVTFFTLVGPVKLTGADIGVTKSYIDIDGLTVARRGNGTWIVNSEKGLTEAEFFSIIVVGSTKK